MKPEKDESQDQTVQLSEVKRLLLQKRLRGQSIKTAKAAHIPQRVDNGPSVLSFSQQRLWFLHQLEPDSHAYNITFSYRLQGSLDVTAFEHSLNEIVKRHEALRTTFVSVNGEPTQVISSSVELPLSVLGMEGLPEDEKEKKVHSAVFEESRHNFDLSKGPVFRTTLLRCSATEYFFIFVVHHIAFDGWSAGVFLRELGLLYTAFSAGQPSPLSELPIQYADYAVWQREWLQGGVLEDQLGYWKQQLGSEIPVLQLPTDRPRPAVQTSRGATESFLLAKELKNKLNKLSQREGVTLFMTLLAAYHTLLYRYTEQADFAIGSPIANRNRSEIENLIGFFVNTLVLKSNISDDPSFKELLGRVRETTLGAYDHQDLPFEKLVEELQPVRDMSYSPLFQVMFVLQNVSMEPGEFPGLAISPLEIKTNAAMFDMALYMQEKEEGLAGTFEFNTDLFNGATIARMAGHFCTLLESIVADPAKRISELTLLPEAERQQMLVEWNTTEATYSAEKTLVHLFEDQVMRTPEAVAVDFEGAQLTYGELSERANKLAHYLQSQGVVPESRVGIWMERSLDMMVALLGTLKAGAAYVPLDPSYPQERLAFMLSDAQVSVLLTMEKFFKDLPEYAGHVVCMDKDQQAIAQGSEENPTGRIAPDNAAYVIYTSGSTGTPKGVVGLHRGAVNRLNWMWRVYPFKDGEVCCQKTYLSFVDSVWEIFGPLLKGVRTVIIPDEAVKDPDLLIESLTSNHVTRIVLVPSLLRVLLDSFGDLQKRLVDLRIWVSSGEEISVELTQRFREVMPDAKLINLYGSSEVSADVTCYEIGDELQEQRVPIGQPIDNTSIYILDSHQQPVPIGVPGELYIGGVGLARGYLNRPDLEFERFILNPFQQGEVLFKTGDLGRYLLDGNIEYRGRKDHQVKIRGFRVELGEIESHIKEVEAITDCVVVLKEDRPADTRMVAYYTVEDEQAVGISGIRRHLQTKLPDYMLPQHFVELSSIPLMPNGKVDRKALPKPETDASLEYGYVAPRSETEQKIATIW
ncbi:amino acid adenylation domain-containing protein, partial [Desulfobacterales bacterium]|nr:amino acid adenylation domain-containing protein [Desulfobacterales bacterium]